MLLDKLGLSHGSGSTYSGDVRLEGKKIVKGRLKVSIEALPIPNVVGRSSGELQGVRHVDDIVSLIDLKLVGASNLGTHNHAVFKVKNDPFATVSFGLHQFRTAVVPDTNAPAWDQLCPLWITKLDNNASALIKISVWDHERLGKAVLIGNAYLSPSKLKANHQYDVILPLTLEDATTDAQLSVLLQDLQVHHSPPPSASAASSPPSSNPTVKSPTGPPSVDSSKYGSVHLSFMVKPRDQVEREFYAHMLDDYDTDSSRTMSLGEITHMLTTIGAKLTADEIELAFHQVDVDGTGALTADQLPLLFRTAAFEQKAVLRTLYGVMVYGKAAFDSLLMKGVLQGSNTGLALDVDPTVDNEGTKIMVQDRDSGMVVAENIPAYIKSALVLLNRSWAGKLAHNKLRGTIKKLTVRQGRKMNDPKSRLDIPNFIKIHKLNMAEVELPLERYATFNEFFSRRLRPGARTCFAEGDDSIAVSPADCRMMVFHSIDESRRLWVKGEKFGIVNLFDGWDHDGRMSAKFNGAELAICRLAPQDYHRSATRPEGERRREGRRRADSAWIGTRPCAPLVLTLSFCFCLAMLSLSLVC